MLARLRHAFGRAGTVAYRTWVRYDLHHGELLAAALAYYALLSLAPLMLLATMLVGLVFEGDQARTTLLEMIRQFASPALAAQTDEVLDTMRAAASDVAAAIALLTLLWASSRLFVQLQAALNAVWGVEVNISSKRATLRRMVVKRLVSFAMVAAAGLLLMVLVLLNTVLSTLSRHLVDQLPAGITPVTAMLQNYAVSLTVLSCFFAVIYRVLPDARIPWREVWVGAILTAMMMLSGTALLSFVIGRLSGGFVNGALGSIAAFVLWIYYQAQVFMFGVAFTREWVQHNDRPIRPENHAKLR